MSRVPAPSRRVLTALIKGRQPPTLLHPSETGIERMFNDLLALLERQDETLVALDRLAPQVNNEDEAAAYRMLGTRVARLADATADMAAALLLAPTERACDLQLKLIVLIAASEPHLDDAHTFPGLYLRTLLADLRSRPLSTAMAIIDHDRRDANS